MQTCLPSDNLLCYLNDLKLLISGHVLIEARKSSRMTIHTIIGKIILIECKIDFFGASIDFKPRPQTSN